MPVYHSSSTDKTEIYTLQQCQVNMFYFKTAYIFNLNATKGIIPKKLVTLCH